MLSIGKRSMSIKRVLVTGATGRTGSLVVQKLQQRPNDFEVIAFARSEAKAKALFDTTDGFFFGDINQSSTLNAAFSGMVQKMAFEGYTCMTKRAIN